MALTTLQKRELLLTADQWIRRHEPPTTASTGALARYLWERVRADQRQPYVNYQNVARQALRMASSARSMQDDPETEYANLPTDPGISSADRRYGYRVVVVGRDNAGEESYSTAVTVQSSTPLSGKQVMDIAEQIVRDNFLVPLSPPPPGHMPRQISGFERFIMMAGRRS